MPRNAWLGGMLAALLLAVPAQSATRDELEQTREDMQAAKERQEQLTEKQEALESELSALQRHLVKSAASMQRMEKDLAAARDKLRVLDAQLAAKDKTLAGRREKLAALTNAALHLSRMPPEAMVMLSGDQDTMKAAQALKMTSDQIRREMEGVRLQSEELKRLQDKAARHREALEQKKEAFAKDRQALQKKLAERKTLQQKLGTDVQEEVKKLAVLAKKAENLQGLLTDIRRRESAPEPGRSRKRSFSSAKGRLRLPVAGDMVQGFGEDGGKRDDTAKGIVLLAGAADAQVVAPFDGEVVFAGPFLNYGRLVILRHSGDFHTLLAGLRTIDAGVGDFLLEGEPIGAMGNNVEERRLYVELREHNRPVNPEPWIKELNHKKR